MRGLLLVVFIMQVIYLNGQWPVDSFNLQFKCDFENNEVGNYTNEEFDNDWYHQGWFVNHDDVRIVDQRGTKAFKFFYPSGTSNMEDGHGGKFWAYFNDPSKGDTLKFEEVYFSFDIMFKPGFDAVRSGKVPSPMAGERWPTSYSYPKYHDGSSGGIRWSGDKNGDSKSFRMFSYMYTHNLTHVNPETKQLEQYVWGVPWTDPQDPKRDLWFRITEEKWHNFTARYVMNTVNAHGQIGDANGIMECFLDGELVMSTDTIIWRNIDNIGISLVRIYSQFGGLGEAFETKADEWILIDNVYTWTYSESVEDVPRGRETSEWGRIIGLPASWSHVKFPGSTEEKDAIAPSVPGNFHASEITRNSVSLAWDASEDNVRATGYRIFKDDNVITATTRTDYEEFDLQPGTTYKFAVSAIDAAGNESPQTEALQITTEAPDALPPSTPTGLSMVRVTGNSLEFKWNPSEDDTGVDQYEIHLNDGFLGNSDTTYYKASGLLPNTLYEIRIRALDEAGNVSPFSNPLSRTTESADTQHPTQPTGLKAVEVTKETIYLTWDPSEDNVMVSRYLIHLNNEVKEESTDNEEVITGLNAGLSYVISVSALDEAGNESPESEEIEVSTLNNDFTLDPRLPELNIVDLQRNSSDPGSVTEMKSLGYAELDAYGIMVSQDNTPLEEGSPFFAEESLTEVENSGRITEALQLLYNFSETEDYRVADISGVGEAIDLNINKPLKTSWLPGQGLKILGNAILVQEGASSKLSESLASSNEFTIETWINQRETNQKGPATLVSLSDGESNNIISLGHSGNTAFYNYVAKLSTSESPAEGAPALITTTDFTSTSLHHVVYTRDNQGVEKIYVNGIELASGINSHELFQLNEGFTLTLGNELDGNHSWMGIFYLVAVYSKALDSEEVAQNYNSGSGKIKYTTKLATLQPNITYQLSPFVKTDQGIVYGEKKSFTIAIDNVLFSEEGDSLYMAIYPNPSNGSFKVRVEYENTPIKPAIIRIVDLSGRVHYIRRLDFVDEEVITDLDFNLSNQLSPGIYTVVLTVGDNSGARRLLIQ